MKFIMGIQGCCVTQSRWQILQPGRPSLLPDTIYHGTKLRDVCKTPRLKGNSVFIPAASSSQRDGVVSEQSMDRRSWDERYNKVLGQEDHILSQANGVEEELFKGDVLGSDADITTGELHWSEMRSLSHLSDDYYIPERFLDTVAVHLAKNFLVESIRGKVPLILGVWGAKGCGKSFNVELCCKRMGLTPIIISAGELEDEWAGEPGKLLRSRYRSAAQYIHAEGKPSCLVINDIDAGVGRQKNTTGYTVNTQLVQATLMNLCDRPTEVVTGEYWVDKQIPRVPIIVTGNDLSRLYAPLIRDGRMDKFYWQPDRSEMTQMLLRLFEADGLSQIECEGLVDAFPDQPLDFFGALRSRAYDSAVRHWIEENGVERLGEVFCDSLRGVSDAPTLKTNPKTCFQVFMQAGTELALEQEYVKSTSLSREYMRWQKNVVAPEGMRVYSGNVEMKSDVKGPEHKMTELAYAMVERLMSGTAPTEEELDAEEQEIVDNIEQERIAREANQLWIARDAEKCHELINRDGYTYVDIRSRREYNRECPKGSRCVPAVVVSGVSLDAKLQPEEDFGEMFKKDFPDLSSKLIVSSASGGGDYGKDAISLLVNAGYTDIIELDGGYEAWSKLYTPAGIRRQHGKWGTPGSQEHDYWTASN